METTINNILNAESLKNELEIIAGTQGIDKIVSAITVMEVEDFDKFDLDNFFILTTFSFLRDNTNDIPSLFKKLINKGISGLAIKPGRFIKKIPRNVIDTANTYNIPLVLVNSNSRFHNIISEISLLINENHLNKTQDINNRYEELYNAFIEGKNINFFVEKLSSLIEKPVITTDEHFNVLSSHGNHFLRHAMDQFEKMELISFSDSHYGYYEDLDMFIYPCKGYHSIVGYIMIGTNQEFNEIELINLKQLATFITMKLNDTNLVGMFKQRERIKLIRNMLLYDTMSTEEIAIQLQSLNFKMSDYYQLHYFTVDSTYNHSLILQIISDRLKSFMSGDEFLLERLKNGFLLIVSTPHDQPFENGFYPKILKEILENLTLKPDYLIGFSPFIEKQVHFSEIFSSIINSMKFSKVLFPSEKLVCTEDFIDYKLLYNTRESSVYLKTFNNYVNPLRQIDNKKDQVYWNTLKETIYTQTIQEAADNLFIHKTTVKYRLDKIKQLINLDFYNPVDKIKLIHVFMIYTIESTIE